LLRLPQHRQNAFAVMIDGEALQFRVGIRAFVKTIGESRIVARADARASNGKPQTILSVELAEQRLPFFRGKLREQIAGGIGESAAKSENFLKSLARINADSSHGRFGDRAPSFEFNLLQFAVVGSNPGLHPHRRTSPKRACVARRERSSGGKLQKVPASAMGHGFLLCGNTQAEHLRGAIGQKAPDKRLSRDTLAHWGLGGKRKLLAAQKAPISRSF